MSKPSSPARASGATLVTLLGSSAALVGLAVYQWLELLQVRAGHTPSCSINEVINCAAVWNSPFAHRVHELLGVPVAGLGVLWGLVAFVLAGLFAQRSRATGDGSTFSGAVKVWALVGLLSCVTFITASVQAKAVCLTCLGTYGLVVVYAVVALRALGEHAIPSFSEAIPGMGWALVLTVPLYVGLLYPGSKTPTGTETAVTKDLNDDRSPEAVGKLIDSLPEQDRLSAAWAREQWTKSPIKDTSMFPTHLRKGPADAPVKLVEFSDVLCGHCAQFERLAEELERLAPPNAMSFEPRYYPLDGECNPDIKGSSKDGVRCYGAKLQICTEQHPKFFELRRELFQNQGQLDQGMMAAIAMRYGFDMGALNACIASPETQARLTEDLAYARLHGIQGTPLVLLNGKNAPPAPAFLVGMVVSKGDVDAPFFLRLPPPPAE